MGNLADDSVVANGSEKIFPALILQKPSVMRLFFFSLGPTKALHGNWVTAALCISLVLMADERTTTVASWDARTAEMQRLLSSGEIKVCACSGYWWYAGRG